MNQGHMASSWELYRQLMGIQRCQSEEAREAFFAGAAVLFRGIMLKLDPGMEPTEADMAFMTELSNELDAFGEEFDRAHLGRILDRVVPARGRA